MIIGGKSLFKVRAGTKAKNISRKEQIRDVPRVIYIKKLASEYKDWFLYSYLEVFRKPLGRHFVVWFHLLVWWRYRSHRYTSHRRSTQQLVTPEHQLCLYSELTAFAVDRVLKLVPTTNQLIN